MLDLTEIIGTFEWQQITINDSNFCVPDVEYCCRFILLCIVIFYLIKGIFTFINTLK